ncbi:hypothetical protein [Rhizobium leguminosarum]
MSKCAGIKQIRQAEIDEEEGIYEEQERIRREAEDAELKVILSKMSPEMLAELQTASGWKGQHA